MPIVKKKGGTFLHVSPLVWSEADESRHVGVAEIDADWLLRFSSSHVVPFVFSQKHSLMMFTYFPEMASIA